ncbi:MAG: rod shape-determining protein MreC [Bacteroidia bacterium]|nr:rod shape-determining protein MreC [Bacteroidia bacterium]NNJ56174.1 rod shape-determining protein MreC [Bacteroidia bacterium]
MQRLLAFLEHNLYLILFVLLQAVCAFLIFNLNPYQQASFTHAATSVTARVNQTTSNVTNYIGLKDQNEHLQNQVAEIFLSSPNSVLTYLNDTIDVQDSFTRSMYSMVPAQVLYNTVHKANNVFVINKGKKHGIHKNMGVVSSQGVAGIVLKSSNEYSTVMSMLNTNMKVIPTINGSEFFTELIWDNEQPYSLKIKGINNLEEIEIGDLVATGNSSLLFPSGIPIGRISKLETKPNSQYFNTEIVTSTNFRTMEYVFVIINHKANEIGNLIEDVE